ncbi:hypothetical protein TVAG_071650 [Trichomonas vaginalis G3]|uniref:Golgi apparatus membrane protein TVP23 homolog n=1 Tax=Trichomonas vaginalis (strain ATCC PRA-98 / G3) TaxID=412133 RepID=A2D868_TRIV3|nr:Golgi APPARATUS membrane protein TVP23 family [Trichomonas vaginalis G3]EAY23501.1 hypothetical protein TVAG_071650 [Trichomonas vaginalis G3]KAI5493923.1 Golgi APPARATUS membrane protein TVP23 family [Trichomonas vaginalis G3]|eukprot:XP_001584487.1 hypothetical protein [Trichomonas vaginalis G3]
MIVNNRELGFHDDGEISIVQSYPVFIYLITQILPIIVYFCPHIQIYSNDISYIFFLILEVIEFILVKNEIGFELIGIKWFFDPSSDEILQFSNRSAPYVPKVFESNVFWIAFFIEIALWIMTIIGTIAQKTLYGFIITFLVLGLYVTNLLIFMRGQSKALKEATDYTRNTLLTEQVEFAKVAENDEIIDNISNEDSYEESA